MNTKGRKLLQRVAALLVAVVLLVAAYTTTAMASGIGLIDTADVLDIHAEADLSSAVIGQVVDEGRVAILGRSAGWVQIQAGNIVGWVPQENLIETDDTVEEALAANQRLLEEVARGAGETVEEENEDPVQETEVQEAEVLEAVPEPQAEALEAAPEPEPQAEVPAAEAAPAPESPAPSEEPEEITAQADAEAGAVGEQPVTSEQDAGTDALLAGTGISGEDLKLLASIIYCEANGEPYIGKVAVGSVVLNRVKSADYPNTIRDVIYAKGQFSPVRNGSMSKALKYGLADVSCYEAALQALAGTQPVGDKLYFRRVNGRSGQVIGHHVFF